MAIFTYSTKGKRPQDTELIETVKQYCEDKGINMSAVIITQVRKWAEEKDIV